MRLVTDESGLGGGLFIETLESPEWLIVARGLRFRRRRVKRLSGLGGILHKERLTGPPQHPFRTIFRVADPSGAIQGSGRYAAKWAAGHAQSQLPICHLPGAYRKEDLRLAAPTPNRLPVAFGNSLQFSEGRST